jgi:hypothetical protein
MAKQIVSASHLSGPLPTQIETTNETIGALTRAVFIGAPSLRELQDLIDAVQKMEHARIEEVRHLSSVATAAEQKTFLKMLISAWPNAPQNDLAGYGLQLADDVREQRPSRYALFTAARQLRRSSRFLPSICEVLEAITTEDRKIRNMRLTVDDMPRIIARATEKLATIEREEAREAIWREKHSRD